MSIIGTRIKKEIGERGPRHIIGDIDGKRNDKTIRIDVAIMRGLVEIGACKIVDPWWPGGRTMRLTIGCAVARR